MADKSIYQLNRIQEYIMQMRPVLHKSALFSDGTAEYRNPPEPETGESVAIRFRTARDNVDTVWLCTSGTRYMMRRVETVREFDYYEAQVSLAQSEVSYYFEIATGLLTCYYDRYGVSKDVRPQYQFRIVPGFHTPQWAKGAVMYQILTDRFCNGNPNNDVKSGEYVYLGQKVKKIENWDRYPSSDNFLEFYGGDLEGVRQKLDYLQELGIEVIYFNPLFVSPSSHKYDIQDYDYIDPHFGEIVQDGGACVPEPDADNRAATMYRQRVTDPANLEAGNALFARLVAEAHARGIRVILDGVFNHCGSFNKWMDREKIYEGREGYAPGAYASKDSPYSTYFHFQDVDQWPDNATYEGWWGYDTLPKLHYEASEELTEYILSIGRKWVSPPYNADGWRLDVAADLGHSQEFNHIFWKKFRKAVKEANPQAMILAEHYGDPKPWISGDQWDTVMNYDAFMEPLTWFLTGMEKHSDEYRPEMEGNSQNFTGAMRHYMASFLTPSLQCAMNELSNHDHSRFLTRTNHKAGRAQLLGPKAAEEGVNLAVMREAVLVQMTWPGAPTIYYGDEVGVCGFTDPDNRRTYPWGNENHELLAFHKEMIRIHKQSNTLRTGSFRFLKCRQNLLCFGRFTREEQFVILVNNDSISQKAHLFLPVIQVMREGTLEQVMFTSEEGYSTVPVRYQVRDGFFEITLPKYGAVLLKSVSEKM